MVSTVKVGQYMFAARIGRVVAITEHPSIYDTTLLRLRFTLNDDPKRYGIILLGLLVPYGVDTIQLSVLDEVREVFAPFDGMKIMSSRTDIDNLKASLLAHAHMALS